MLNLPRLKFKALDTSGKNYLMWAHDAELYLNSKGLGGIIADENKVSSQDKAKALILLRRHLSEELQDVYSFVEIRDPLVLWNSLKQRYERDQKTIMLMNARYEWERLRVEDFKTVWEYNSAIFRIKSQLEMGGGEVLTDKDMLEKTYSTLRTCNVHLKNVCRERLCKTYCEFIVFLVLAEQNNEIVLKNDEACACGSSPFIEENDICRSVEQNQDHGYHHGRGYNRGRGYHRGYNYGRGYNRGRGRGRGNWNRNDPSTNFYSHLKCNRS